MKNIETTTTNNDSIKNVIEHIVDTVKSDAKEVQKFAEEKGFSYISIPTDSLIDTKIRKEYPETYFSNASLNLINGVDSVVRDVFIAIRMALPNAINMIGFDSLNEKKKTIKVTKNSSYNQYWFEKYFFQTERELFENVVKEYQNGSVIYQLTDDQFDRFKEIINFDTKETDQIIAAIQPEDKIKYLEVTKSTYGNPYNVIYQIKERLGMPLTNLVPVNYIRVFNELKM